VRRDAPVVGVRDVERVVIEGGEGACDAAHDRHRVRVAPETLEKLHQLLVHHRVVTDGVVKLCLFRPAGQFAV